MFTYHATIDIATNIVYCFWDSHDHVQLLSVVCQMSSSVWIVSNWLCCLLMNEKSLCPGCRLCSYVL